MIWWLIAALEVIGIVVLILIGIFGALYYLIDFICEMFS